MSDTKKCKHCQMDIPKKAKVCPYCRKKQTSKAKTIAIVVFVFFCLYAIGTSDTNTAKTEHPIVAEKETQENKEALMSYNMDSATAETEQITFEQQMSAIIGETTTNTIVKVLNDAGFTDITFKQRMGDTYNFEIAADGYVLRVTAFEDELISIWNSNAVVYENGNIKDTKSDIIARSITSNQMIVYKIISEEIIDECLINSFMAKYSNWGMCKDGNIVAVSGTVKAKNAFNAKVQERFVVEFEIFSENAPYSYNVLYVQIGDTKAGTFVDINK